MTLCSIPSSFFQKEQLSTSPHPLYTYLDDSTGNHLLQRAIEFFSLFSLSVQIFFFVGSSPFPFPASTIMPAFSFFYLRLRSARRELLHVGSPTLPTYQTVPRSILLHPQVSFPCNVLNSASTPFAPCGIAFSPFFPVYNSS